MQINMEVFYGTVAGLVFSLFIYILTNIILDKLKKNKYKTYLKSELDYNCDILNKIIDRIRSDRTSLSTGQIIYATYRLNLFQIGILNKTFEWGYFFDYFIDQKIKRDILEFANYIVPKLNDIDYSILDWQNQRLTKEDLLSRLSFQEGELQRIKENLNEAIKKLK